LLYYYPLAASYIRQAESRLRYSSSWNLQTGTCL